MVVISCDKTSYLCKLRLRSTVVCITGYFIVNVFFNAYGFC